MKNGALILIAGLLLCVGAFCGFNYLGTASHREMMHDALPELAWLKKKFALNDAEYAQVFKLHEAYRPHCREMCRRIEEQNAKLKQILAHAKEMTPEIESAIADSARLRGDCQRDMLRHLLEVSKIMRPEPAKRYVAWVQERTLLVNAPMSGER